MVDLEGALDVHVHTAPDIPDRYSTDVELSEAVRDAGMFGAVVKNHVVPTVARAAAVNEALDEEVLYGGIVLNGPVGGLNPDAVEVALGLGARIVWLPTFWHQNHARRFHEAGTERVRGLRIPTPSETISLVSGDDVAPEVRRIVELVGDHDAVLATGHACYEEALPVVRVCEELGTKCLVNHPFSRQLDATVAEHERLVEHGAVLEYCGISLEMVDDHSEHRLAEAIERVGPEHCLLASDFGQAGNDPVGGLEALATDVVDAGLSEETVRDLLCSNPRRLLGV